VVVSSNSAAASLIVDGDSSTQWQSTAANFQSLDVDLGQKYSVKKIAVKWGGNYATAYTVKLSADRFTWDVVRTIGNGAGGNQVFDSLNLVARYAQLLMDTRVQAATGFAVQEFEVYGLPQAVSVSNSGSPVPERFALSQNYPNPFNPSTMINFAVPSRSQVIISIYNVIGQKVAEVANGTFEAGYHAARWTAKAASGVYFCRMEAVTSQSPAQRFLGTTKLMLMK
jgi:hypothetical protein